MPRRGVRPYDDWVVGQVESGSDASLMRIGNPILNSPFDPPQRHFELGLHGPTGVIFDGRRPSESFIPVPVTRKGRRSYVQEQLDFDVTGERREANTLINDMRREVELWRANNWNGVTPYSRKLLAHWSAGPPTRDDPVFFCQREAAPARTGTPGAIREEGFTNLTASTLGV